MAFENPVVGGTALRIPAIQSPNYAAGSAGWIIKIDGSAEFNNLVVRGTFEGTNFIINAAGIFLYSSTPAAGNLVGSWANAAGTDAFTNAYPQGLTIGVSTLPQVALFASALGSSLSLPTNRSLELTDGLLSGRGIGISGQPGEVLQLEMRGPAASTATDFVSFRLTSQNRGATSNAAASIRDSVAGALHTWTSAASTVAVPLVYSQTLLAGTVDVGAGIKAEVSITANVTGITTEAVLMTIPSITYTNGRAYRVTLWGLQQSTTASTFFVYRLRKGTATITGTIYKDQIRIPVLSTANTNGAVSATVVLVNVSGADITTDITWTAICNAGTGIFAASAGNVAHATVEDVGLSSQWPGQPIT